MKYKIQALQKRIGYYFAEIDYLIEALTHSSYQNLNQDCNFNNQRLEFLGDAVLGLILGENRFYKMPNAREGKLAQARAVLAQKSFLINIAKRLKIDLCMRRGMLDVKARSKSILEDGLEAIIGAIYCDSNFTITRKVVLNWYGNIDNFLEKSLVLLNPKGKLQEKMQSQLTQYTLKYELLKSSGPDHCKNFTVAIKVDNKIISQGEGYSKKNAEEAAAKKALKKFAKFSRIK